MTEFETRVCGIPCIIRVNYWESYVPAKINGPPEHCYPEEGGTGDWEDRWGVNHYVDPKEPHPAQAKPLYTAPPAAAQRQWVGLTEYERAECWYGKNCLEQKPPFDGYAEAIEAKHKEKNI